MRSTPALLFLLAKSSKAVLMEPPADVLCTVSIRRLYGRGTYRRRNLEDARQGIESLAFIGQQVAVRIRFRLNTVELTLLLGNPSLERSTTGLEGRDLQPTFCQPGRLATGRQLCLGCYGRDRGSRGSHPSSRLQPSGSWADCN